MARQLGGIQVPGWGPGPAAGERSSSRPHPTARAAIGVPPGWRIIGYSNGAVDVAGPQGRFVDVGIYLPIMVRPTFVGPVAGTTICPFIADPVAAVPVVSQAIAQADHRPRRPGDNQRRGAGALQHAAAHGRGPGCLYLRPVPASGGSLSTTSAS